MKTDTRQLSCSIIIPTHQRRDLVIRLLTALSLQDMREIPTEIIVVADGCRDGTEEAVSKFTSPHRLRLLKQTQSGQGAARNNGARVAIGNVLVFFDDDVVPPKDYFARMLRSVEERADVVVPFVRVGEWVPDSLLAREQRRWDRSVYRDMQDGAPTIAHFHTMATMIGRDCFEEIGGFDPEFTKGGAWGREDTDLGYRLTQAGCRISFRPDVIVDSDCVTDPTVALRRGRDRGRNDIYLVSQHPELASRMFGSTLKEARIQRTVGHLILLMPFVANIIVPLRFLVIKAAAKGHAGKFFYKIWLLTWAIEWWLGVVEAGGRKEALRLLGK